MIRAPKANWLGVFGPPLLIAILSSAGLVSALTDDSAARVFAWFALASPIVLIGWHVSRSCRRR
jgi:hypothetical protein